MAGRLFNLVKTKRTKTGYARKAPKRRGSVHARVQGACTLCVARVLSILCECLLCACMKVCVHTYICTAGTDGRDLQSLLSVI